MGTQIMFGRMQYKKNLRFMGIKGVSKLTANMSPGAPLRLYDYGEFTPL